MQGGKRRKNKPQTLHAFRIADSRKEEDRVHSFLSYEPKWIKGCLRAGHVTVSRVGDHFEGRGACET